MFDDVKCRDYIESFPGIAHTLQAHGAQIGGMQASPIVTVLELLQFVSVQINPRDAHSLLGHKVRF